MKKIGIDLGGTKIEIVLLNDSDDSIDILERKRIPTDRDKGYEHILHSIHQLYESILKDLGNDEHSIGIGTPGVLAPSTGCLIQSNTTCLQNKPILSDLQELCQHKISIENDANCFALAEALHGAGKGHSLVFGAILGTGCGGGIVIDGKLRRGPHSGEWGHMVMDPDGAPCYCGFRGCIETAISGGGLQDRWQREHKEKKSMNQIIEAYRKGDEKATPFIQTFIKDFGQAMANLINAVDPDVLVLGGGLSNLDEVYTDGIESLKNHFFDPTRKSPIIKNQLGDSAGVIGAAFIGAEA